MNPPQIDEIAGRLDRLERANRRLKAIGLAALCTAAALLAAGAYTGDQDKIVTGEKLVVESRDGKSGFDMGVNPDGEPMLTFRRTADAKRFAMELRMLVAGDGVPVLVFVDQDGTQRYKIPR